ncbi:MAG: hypothetical protein RSB28_06220 [Oscillospiraceae bacterium]
MMSDVTFDANAYSKNLTILNIVPTAKPSMKIHLFSTINAKIIDNSKKYATARFITNVSNRLLSNVNFSVNMY